MSTRCNIIVKEGRRKSYIYHHCDGYPSGVGIMVKEYLDGLYNWYQFYIMNDIIKHGLKYTDYKGTQSVDDTYEWTNSLHGDIDYIYVIDCDKKTFTCYKRISYDIPVDNKFTKTFKIIQITD